MLKTSGLRVCTEFNCEEMWQVELTKQIWNGKFNTKQLYVLPTRCIYVFCVDLRTKSHYFPIQH
jgi:hypothetical protein